MTSLAQSYRACRRITARASSTFYLASLLFDAPIRRDIQVLYAFCRVADDIVDASKHSDEQKRALLKAMQQAIDTHQACEVEPEIWPALFAIQARYRLPKAQLKDVLRGVGSDIVFAQPKTLAQLDEYSYYVAGVVGLLSARILGAQKASTYRGARQLGIAMQYTNIIRDVAADHALDRIYIPKSIMREYGVRPSMLDEFPQAPELVAALTRLTEQAEGYYAEAEAAIRDLPVGYQKPVRVATALYRGVLERVKQKRYTVLDGRVRLNRLDKLAVVWDTYRGR